MSSFRGPMSETGLDRMLDHWLSEGPESAPDRVVDGAIRAAVATNQRQWPTRLARMAAWHSPAVPVGLTVAGIAAVGMVAMGLSLVGDVQPGDQSPEPTISSPPSVEAPAGLRLYTNSEAGFEVLVPRGWTEIQPEAFDQSYPGVVAFGHEYDNANFLTISVGQPDGSFYRCDFICEKAEATTLDELEEVLAIPRTVLTGTPAGFDEVPVAIVVEETTLAGVEARFAHFDPEREGVAPLENVAFALVEGRPVVLTFVPFPNWGMAGYPVSEIIDSNTVRAILDSFRLETAPPESFGLELYTNQVDGYEMYVPAAWEEVIEPAYGEPHPGVVRFKGDDGGRASLVVSIGSTTGGAFACTGPACRPISVHSLEEISRAVDQAVRGPVGFEIRTIATVLDGEPAQFEYPVGPGSGHYLMPADTFHCFVYTFHEDRPVILSFSCGSSIRSTGPAALGLIRQVIETFRFVE